jgi:hypothetical protein
MRPHCRRHFFRHNDSSALLTLTQSSTIALLKCCTSLKAKLRQFIQPCEQSFTFFLQRHDTATRQSILTRGPDIPPLAFEQLVFRPSQIPHQSQTCDNLLHRIRDLFRPPQFLQEKSSKHAQPHAERMISSAHEPPSPITLQVGALARVVCVCALQKASISPQPSRASSSKLGLEWEFPSDILLEMFPNMEVFVLRLHPAHEPNFAFVRVPKDQKGFPLCKDQEGYVEIKNLVALAALYPCNSAAVCLMRCVQRVALRVRTICSRLCISC